MRKVIVILLFTVILTGPLAHAALLSSPKPIDDRETLLYLRKIRDVIGKVEIVTTDPNGNIRGSFEDVLIYNNSGTYTLKVNTDTGIDGGTTWVTVS